MRGTLLDPAFGGLSGRYPIGQGVTLFEARLEPLREDLRTWASVIQVGSAIENTHTFLLPGLAIAW
jgi:hypothetical protein